jgi:hypothetical protein
MGTRCPFHRLVAGQVGMLLPRIILGVQGTILGRLYTAQKRTGMLNIATLGYKIWSVTWEHRR